LAGIPKNLVDRYVIFGKRCHRGNPKADKAVIPPPEVNLISGMQLVEPVKHRRPLVGIQMPNDDRRSVLAWR
jgi:hypothetical protein